jgi:hypothetical protein
MHCVGFEPTIQASERAKTVDALDGSATVTGNSLLQGIIDRVKHYLHLRVDKKILVVWG